MSNQEFKRKVDAILIPAFTQAFEEIAKRGYDIRAVLDKNYDTSLQIKADKVKAA